MRQAFEVPLADATRSVALLGPTNTGKTHRAVERMLEHSSGMIGLPLRLLAREIYDRVTSRVGEDRVALVTGEEKRVPRRPEYWVCTTEAMPLAVEVDFLAVDEIQLATHDERGHIFTERLLHARGRRESWFLGSQTMSAMVERLVPAARQERHPRLSRLSFAGASPLQRLPPRSAVIAFSIPELYALAGRLRALRGGAALVLGALSPRARNAQVAMFQAGEVDYLVATDAVGMGLNLDVSHVAFASLRKFDGRAARTLEPAELAQIAGRAGRYLRDGTFGTLSPLEMPHDVASLIEQHRFEPVRRLRYRNASLDFSSPAALIESLELKPPAPYLTRVPDALDLRSLRALLSEPAIARAATSRERLELLWSVCVIPDYRQILFEVHLDLLRDIFGALLVGPLSNDFVRARTLDLEESDADVDGLLARLARLRTWAFVVNHAGWVADSEHWRAELERLEVRLSEALHAALVASFVEKRTRAKTQPRRARQLPAEAPGGEPIDVNHPFAALAQLRAKVSSAAPDEGRPASSLEELVDAPHSAFALDARGHVLAGETKLGTLVRGASLTRPDVRLAPLEELAPGVRLRLQRRVLAFTRDSISRLLGPIGELGRSENAAVRAVAYQLERGLGCARVRDLRATIDGLDDVARLLLAERGVVVGRIAVFLPALLGRDALSRRAMLIQLSAPELLLPPLGRSQFPAHLLAPDAWLALGYVVLGGRACRVDLAERAAAALEAGAPTEDAFRCLSIPRRDAARAARAVLAVRSTEPPRVST